MKYPNSPTIAESGDNVATFAPDKGVLGWKQFPIFTLCSRAKGTHLVRTSTPLADVNTSADSPTNRSRQIPPTRRGFHPQKCRFRTRHFGTT